MRFKFIKKIIIIFIAFNIVSTTLSQMPRAEKEMNFKNITIEDGLTQSSVEALFQDSDGYIWFGTNDGLNRYDGYKYKIYRNKGEEINSLVNNYILDIKEDKNKNIWVATADGLSRIHDDRETITNYLGREKNGSLSHSNSTSILITKNDDILVATAKGINIYNEKTDSFEAILKDNDLSNQYVNSIDEDYYGNIWAGTENGLYKLNKEYNLVEHYTAKDDENSISENNIYKVYYDSNGYIWIGTYNNGANRINLKTNEITSYKHSGPGTITGDNVKNFLRDRNGQMWICTDKGLSFFDENSNTFKSYTNKIYDKNSLVSNNIFSIIEDNTGLIWLGTYRGVSMFNPISKIQHFKNNPFNNNSLSDDMVLSMYEDDEGLLWIGTSSKGINIFNRENDKYEFITLENSKDIIPDNTIYDIKGHGDLIFIGTSEGLSIYNKKTSTSDIYNTSSGLPNNTVKNIYYDSKGYLWIGTASGLVLLDVKNKTMIDLKDFLQKYSPEDMYVGEIFEDSDGEYWIGIAILGGLIRINPNTSTVTVYRNIVGDPTSLSSNSIRSINEDKQGNIWVGTNLGLNKFNKEVETFERYTTSEGLSNNTVYGILIDEQDNPWMSTNYGLSKLNVEDNTFFNLTLSYGLQSNEFNGEAYCTGKNGEFYFGGINGFNIFKPEDIKDEINFYNLIMNEFQINGVTEKYKENKKFDHEKNNIYIEVFFPIFKDKHSIKYYYKIEGKDDNWIGMDGPGLNLVNLSPGSYVVKFVAKNNNGAISEEMNVKFSIEPPFFISKYSILIYILIIILIWKNSRMKMKRLDKLVDNRTIKLSEEMERNNKLLNKIIQLEQNKNNYFINMSHELRTPLNVIFSTEQLISELNKNEKGIDREKLNYYMKVVNNNVKRLLKIINDLIDTSKIDYGNYKLNFEKINIVYVVEEATLSLKDYIENKGINIVVDPDIEEKFIYGDKNELDRCITNIVGNAAKFTKEGGNIQVRVIDLDKKVKIEIIDDGIGIDKKYHKVIFNRFNQVVDENSEVNGGSGLGLTITKKIIDLHHGDIFVNSQVNKGTKFTIVLPTVQPKKY